MMKILPSIYRSVCYLLFCFSPNQMECRKPPAPHKKLLITTDEGTWMNIDVSLDGKSIAFDLFRRYLYHAGYQVAKQLCFLAVSSWEVQPRV